MPLALLAAFGRAGPLAEAGVLAARRLRSRLEGALSEEPLERFVPAAVARLEGDPLLLHEAVEVRGPDQLVLGAVDEADEGVEVPVGVRLTRVVAQREVRADLPKEEQLPDPVEESLYEMDAARVAQQGIRELPGSLEEAIAEMIADSVVTGALGDHVLSNFLEAKRAETEAYRIHVSQWELDRYLGTL